MNLSELTTALSSINDTIKGVPYMYEMEGEAVAMFNLGMAHISLDGIIARLLRMPDSKAVEMGFEEDIE